MTTTIGLFVYNNAFADLLLPQCDGPLGHHKNIQLQLNNPHADHILCIGPPPPPPGSSPSKLPWLARKRAKASGTLDAANLRLALSRLNRAPSDITMLVYEPPTMFSDAWYAVAKRYCSRVFGPDPRATHQITLPAMWTFDDRLESLRDEPPSHDRPIELACITSGKSFLPGHRDRLRFLHMLVDAKIPIKIFGQNLPASLNPQGPLRSKATILRAARFTLAIENFVSSPYSQSSISQSSGTGFQPVNSPSPSSSSPQPLATGGYITEKLWDPLVCWSLPIYFGPPPHLYHPIPKDAVMQLPSLDEAGVELVQRTLVDSKVWENRVQVMKMVRNYALFDGRLTDWLNAVMG